MSHLFMIVQSKCHIYQIVWSKCHIYTVTRHTESCDIHIRVMWESGLSAPQKYDVVCSLLLLVMFIIRLSVLLAIHSVVEPADITFRGGHRLLQYV